MNCQNSKVTIKHQIRSAPNAYKKRLLEHGIRNKPTHLEGRMRFIIWSMITTSLSLDYAKPVFVYAYSVHHFVERLWFNVLMAHLILLVSTYCRDV